MYYHRKKCINRHKSCSVPPPGPIHVQNFPSNPMVAAKYFKDTFKDKMNELNQKIEVVNVRLSPELIKIIDSLIEQGLYSSRSEFIRDICRNYVLEERHKDE
jgi:hypothetical protein